MLLKEITIRNFRLLEDVTIPFTSADGNPRRWTVLIGRNGAGKTSVLQAIALAAAGNSGALSLVEKVREGLLDARSTADATDATIDAHFGFDEIGQQHGKRPLADRAGEKPTGVDVNVTIPRGRDPLTARSWYVWADRDDAPSSKPPTEATDPLVAARAQNCNHWFVAGYGLSRIVNEPQPGQRAPAWPSIDRLRPLFGHLPLIGPGFLDIFHGEDLHREFVNILSQIVVGNSDVLQGIKDIERRGYGGVRGSRDLLQRPRFLERVGDRLEKFPATWFAHGHQSTIAWLSDLVGQIMLEAEGAVAPRDMEGIVLIDEIDLYLHPRWQVVFIEALKRTFPKLQFVATTHSPILLTGLKREEVWILERSESEGTVSARNPTRDPRLLTGSELYEEFFEIDDLYPKDLARKLDRYRGLAMNALRPASQDAEIADLQRELTREGILVRAPVPRKTGDSEAAE